MAHSDDGDLNDVAMPGFIDILSSVVTIFMFFVLLTAVAMFFMTLQMKKNIVAEQEKKTEERVAQEVQKFVEQFKDGKVDIKTLMKSTGQNEEINRLRDENKHLNEKLVDAQQQLQQSGTGLSESDKQTITLDMAQRQMVIMFGSNALSLTEETQTSIKQFLTAIRSAHPDKTLRFYIQAPDNPLAATASSARQLAFGRMLNIRNILLQEKVAQTGISLHNMKATDIDGSYSWVRIYVELQ